METIPETQASRKPRNHITRSYCIGSVTSGLQSKCAPEGGWTIQAQAVMTRCMEEVDNKDRQELDSLLIST
jgi:hypothetical protein